MDRMRTGFIEVEQYESGERDQTLNSHRTVQI
jgi:hypothetical protein